MKLTKIQLMGIFYFGFLIFVFFYVSNILEEGNIEVMSAPDEEYVEEVKPVKVTLIVDNLGVQKLYNKTLRNKDTLLALLELVREEDSQYYEIVTFIDDVEITEVNKKQTPELYTWRVFYQDKDVTTMLKEINLVDGENYYLKLVEK